MKKTIVLILAVFLVVSVLLIITGCGRTDTTGGDSGNSGESVPGSISLRAIEQAGSKCLALSDGTPIGELLPDATVTAIDRSGMGNDKTTATDEFGEAQLELPPGNYDVLIEADGYEPVTIENKQVGNNKDTALGDVGIGRDENENPSIFNQDRAILLGLMSTIAYADGRGFGNLANKVMGDSLPYPDNTYTNTMKSKFPDYTDCWQFYEFIEELGSITDFGDTQLFIANNVDTEDIVVSFRGTAELADGWTNIGIFKVAWTRNGLDISRAVASGWLTAYNKVNDKDNVVTPERLKNALERVIAEKVTDITRARVYFTGHSLGGGLATLAALDLADWLVDEHGYKRNNIIMYSYGGPRIITENLEPIYNDHVPNSFAVAAKEDPAPHKLGRDADFDVLFPAQYTHIKQLTVLSTNILDINGDGDGRFKLIGKTRVERRNGNPYEGCHGRGTFAVPGGTEFLTRGHDMLQYVKRLEDIVDSDTGIPLLHMDFDDSTNRIILRWDGRPNFVQNSVMGQCDWVAFYETRNDTAPTDPDSYSCRFFRQGWEWAVYGEPTPAEGDGFRRVVTCRDPRGPLDQNKRYWIGYIDGAYNIVKMQGPYRF